MKRLLLICALLSAGCSYTTVDLVKQGRYWEAQDYKPPTTDHWAAAYADLTKRMTDNGVIIQVVELEDALAGRTFIQDQAIVLNAGMNIDGQFEVLAHEAGHLFHLPMYDFGVKELFAELVGVGVQKYYGKDARKSAANYLLRHKHALGALPYIQDDIDEAIEIITGQKEWPQSWR